MDASSLIQFFQAGEQSYIFLNKKRPDFEKKWVEKARLPNWPAHIWISSSGTTTVNEVKLIGLSRRALLSGAEAVNRFLQVNENDLWLNVLPHFHVGGLAIYARAFLSGSKVLDLANQNSAPSYKWDPVQLLQEVMNYQVTLISLVPTQLFDCVRLGLRAPESLRAVLVGGGATSESLYRQARELGWPILPTYGLSEAASQVATAPLSSLNLPPESIVRAELLPHLQAQLTDDGFLKIRGDSLFSGSIYVGEDTSRIEEHKSGDWFVTNDKVELLQLPENKTGLHFLGRAQDLIKVSGEVVNLNRLQALFQTLIQGIQFVVLADSDPRLESRVIIVFEGLSPLKAEKYVEMLNQSVAPYERIQDLYIVDQLPRTDLGKIKVAELKKRLRVT